MITTLIILALRRYRLQNPERFNLLINQLYLASKYVLLLLIGLLAIAPAFTQQRILNYAINRNGSKVGELNFYENKYQDRIIYKINTKVNTQFIIKFNGTGQEESIYKNGILVYSSIKHHLNGREKANKTLQFIGKNYLLVDRSIERKLDKYPITQNMVTLYTSEPINISEIYSDNFQQYVAIKRIRPQHYKINFPDGSSSEYFYENGICTRIKIYHNFYNADVLLSL